ncbi:MAG TPA: TetR/AcrR family transcriptional regulator [Acidimicrobiia bacterium]
MTGPPTTADPLSMRERLLGATYTCVSRYGLGKTTIEDVVKESGVSRATIYRYFPGGRDELVRDTVGWEIANFLTRLGDHVRDQPDLNSLVAEGLRFARHSLESHELLQKILETEPERLLGLLTTESARAVPFIAAFLYPYLEREGAAGRLRDGVDVARSADYLARMVLSLIGSPGRWNYDDPAELADLVRTELLGGIVA